MPVRSRRASRPRGPGDRRAGFTLSELLLVFTIVALITLVAYPSIKTFMGYNEDASAATRLTRTFNRTIDQSRRRNRAYVVDFSVFLPGEPAGRMTISESRFQGCAQTADQIGDADTLSEVEDIPFGGTVVEDYVGPVEDEAGLSRWEVGDEAGNGNLRLCVQPDGASFRIDGVDIDPVEDGLAVRVQRFQREAGRWGRVGPGRRVKVSFGDGAFMEL